MPCLKPTHESLLALFHRWLDRSKHETLKADIVLLRWLDALPEDALASLRIRQLGTRLVLEHGGPANSAMPRGSLMLHATSLRLQHALLNFITQSDKTKRCMLLDSSEFSSEGEDSSSASTPEPAYEPFALPLA